jgi:Holliday junction resolvase RusA-like endonuclease
MKPIRLLFNLKLISKDNEKIFNRAGRFFLSDKYKGFEAEIRYLAKKQYKDNPLEGNLKMTILACFKDKRHSDCQNLSKGVCDSLEGICYINDRQIKHFECIVLEDEPRDSFNIVVEEYLAPKKPAV